MSVCDPFANPNLALYVGDRGFPDRSDPETTMLFPSSWFQNTICLGPCIHFDLLSSHQTGGTADATALEPVLPMTRQ